MRIVGLAILSIFNTIVSLLLIFVLFGLTQLTLGLGNGASDNSALIGYIIVGLVIILILWFGLYQIYTRNRQLWLILFAAIGVVLTIANLRVVWFVLLMVVYFTGILLIIKDNSFNTKA